MLNIKIFFKYRSGTILITEAITSVFLCILLYLRKCTQLSNLLIKDNKATFFQETKPLLYCTCGLLSVNVHNRLSITNLITFAGGALYRVMYCTLCAQPRSHTRWSFFTSCPHCDMHNKENCTN